jgi:hypothetical protein
MNTLLDQEMMNDTEELEGLRREGFTEEEIESLSRLRKTRRQFGDYLTEQECQRLAFVRWLVVTGKLLE